MIQKKRPTRIEPLIEAILSLQNTEEAEQFLHDLFTSSELNELSRRWQAACMLCDKVPYITITSSTGLSSTTVARVSKLLKSGRGGLKILIERLQAEKKEVANGDS